MELARLAELGRDLKRWRKFRGAALRNWEKCSDGRLYHHVVSEKVLEALLSKLSQRKASAAGNAAKRKVPFDPKPFDDLIESAIQSLRKLNPNSRFAIASTKKFLIESATTRREPRVSLESDLPPGAKREPDEHTAGLPPGSQENGREGNGTEDGSDASHRASVPAAVPPRSDPNPPPGTAVVANGNAPWAPDVRTELFREGLELVRHLTGKGEGACRSFLGKCLREVRDDAAVVLDVLREAASTRPADPSSYIAGAIKARAAPPKDTWTEGILKAAGLDGANDPGAIIDHETTPQMRLA